MYSLVVLRVFGLISSGLKNAFHCRCSEFFNALVAEDKNLRTPFLQGSFFFFLNKFPFLFPVPPALDRQHGMNSPLDS